MNAVVFSLFNGIFQWLTSFYHGRPSVLRFKPCGHAFIFSNIHFDRWAWNERKLFDDVK